MLSHELKVNATSDVAKNKCNGKGEERKAANRSNHRERFYKNAVNEHLAK